LQQWGDDGRGVDSSSAWESRSQDGFFRSGGRGERRGGGGFSTRPNFFSLGGGGEARGAPYAATEVASHHPSFPDHSKSESGSMLRGHSSIVRKNTHAAGPPLLTLPGGLAGNSGGRTNIGTGRGRGITGGYSLPR
ncbi:unnamed protein product, partial [Pylaiella littoralis]